MIEYLKSNAMQNLVQEISSQHSFVYPPATPVDVIVIPKISEKIIMPELMIVCQGQWRAGPMNRIIFQPNGTPMVPIFHHSIVPLFQSHDLEALDRL
jgi:hypothetical protein